MSNLCDATQVKLCRLDNCESCYNKSCASHPNIHYLSVNSKFKARAVMKGSDKILLWNCDICGHKDYEMSAYNKCTRNWGCPYCNSKRLHTSECDICYKKSFASHPRAQYWNYELNGTVKPESLHKCNTKKYWFNCDNKECRHTINISPVSITSQNNWCSYCARLLLCTNDSCEVCYNKSFASHPKAVYWNTELNKTINPRTVFKGSNTKKYWFTCEVCNHNFDMVPGSISTHNQWCPYCAKPPQRKCSEMNCTMCTNKTFATSHRANCWNYELNGTTTPRDVFLQTHDAYWFNCDNCPHTFKKTICLIHNENSWCQYCSHDILCDEECEMCFNNSFTSHPKAAYWNYDKNDTIPRKILKSSNRKYWLNCTTCNEPFRMNIDKITCSNYWCPKCKHKTEKIVYSFLLEHFPDTQHQFSVDWCRNIRNLPFDIVIPSLNIIIEVDGPQHIDKQVRNWSTPEENQKNDLYKMDCANKNGYSVIRILQVDVLFNNYDWRKELKEVIQLYPAPTRVFICKNNEYKNHINPSII